MLRAGQGHELRQPGEALLHDGRGLQGARQVHEPEGGQDQGEDGEEAETGEEKGGVPVGEERAVTRKGRAKVGEKKENSQLYL